MKRAQAAEHERDTALAALPQLRKLRRPFSDGSGPLLGRGITGMFYWPGLRAGRRDLGLAFTALAACAPHALISGESVVMSYRTILLSMPRPCPAIHV